MFTSVYHTGYWTDDIEAAVNWHWNVLGSELLGRSCSADGALLAFFRTGNTEVSITQPKDPRVLGGRTGLIIHHVGYLVDDIENVSAAMEARGIGFIGPAYDNGMGYLIRYVDTKTTMGASMHLTQKIL